MIRFTRSVGFLLSIMLLLPLGCGRSGSSSFEETGVGPLQFKETADETIKQSFQAGAKTTIVVDTFAGAIDFELVEGDTVQIEVLKQGGGDTKEEAAENLKNIDLAIKQEGDTIRVTATNPIKPKSKTTLSNGMVVIGQLMGPGKTDVRIKSPARAALEFKTNYGNVAITGAANSLKVNSGSGKIDVKQNSAAFDLSTQYGSINVGGAGAGKAKTSSGAIAVQGCTNPIELESGYGAISVANAAGITAKTNSGEITVKASKGPFQLKTGYGRIELKDANGSTRAESSSGDIHLAGGQGEFTAKTGYGAIKIDVKESPVQAESSSGNIDLRGCSGTVKAQSGYGTVNVHGDNAVVQLRSNSGNVLFEGSLAAGDSRVSSGYGEAVVKLPADSQFKVEASTGYGNIRTQFDLAKTKDTDKQIIGSVGADPKVSLHIESTSGNVRIDKR
jgi:DUF4097 and DUF4098 domain-containing protein YvlB